MYTYLFNIVIHCLFYIKRPFLLEKLEFIKYATRHTQDYS